MVKELEYLSNILIATIDPGISNVLGLLLNNLNYKIELINSGSDAFKELKENKFDLMLLDVVLPDMSAIQVLNYVKKISPETLVIVMAGEDLNSRSAECLQNGAYDCLKKPFRKEEIIKRIENALEQRRLEKEIEGINDLTQITEKRNQYLIINSEDIIYTLDYEGKFTSISDSLQQKLGFDNSYLLRKHFSTVVYPEDINKAMYVFNERRAVSRGLKLNRIRLKKNGPAKALDKFGNCITVEIKANGVYENQHKDKLFLGTYGIARDISDFMKNEEMLRMQKIYFKELFNSSPNAAVVIDNDNKIISVNKNFLRLFKYTYSELKGRHINDLLVNKDYPGHKEGSINSSALFEKESIGKRKDGTIINLMIYGYPIVYNNKNIGVYHVFRNITEIKRNDKELMEHLNKVRQSMGNISNAMVSTVEVRDPYTVGHQQRVSNLARTIASEMGLSSDDVDAIRMAGTLHDLGKVNIPAEILSKPGKLSKIELELIKMHPRIAYDILKKIEFPWEIAEIVHQHHERLDGSGYPNGLKGSDILLGSRILSVADVVESISSHRPYRPALGIRKALEEISSKKNIYFDSKVVDACIRLFNKKNFTFESDLPEENEDGCYRMPAYMAPN
ncbi:MAG: PAS domain S-box protein [Spirochaetes bacterium]|nr:PAS domain S-box protein [Spirochaetota bacterium]